MACLEKLQEAVNRTRDANIPHVRGALKGFSNAFFQKCNPLQMVVGGQRADTDRKKHVIFYSEYLKYLPSRSRKTPTKPSMLIASRAVAGAVH